MFQGCESNPDKQKWIRDAYPSLEYLFHDVLCIGLPNTYNIISARDCDVSLPFWSFDYVVFICLHHNYAEACSNNRWHHDRSCFHVFSLLRPYVQLLVAGFSCKSVSMQNKKRKCFSDCISTSSGQTGSTFRGIMSFIIKKPPKLLLLENVRLLVVERLHCLQFILLYLGLCNIFISFDLLTFNFFNRGQWPGEEDQRSGEAVGPGVAWGVLGWLCGGLVKHWLSQLWTSSSEKPYLHPLHEEHLACHRWLLGRPGPYLRCLYCYVYLDISVTFIEATHWLLPRSFLILSPDHKAWI